LNVPQRADGSVKIGSCTLRISNYSDINHRLRKSPDFGGAKNSFLLILSFTTKNKQKTA